MDLRVMLLLALIGNTTAWQLRVTSAKYWTVPCERSVLSNFSTGWKFDRYRVNVTLKGKQTLTVDRFCNWLWFSYRNLSEKLFDLFHWKWFGYKKMLNTIEQFWYIQIHTWGTTMNNTFLLFYSPKVWLLIYWNWSLFASFTVNLPNAETGQ